MADRSPRRFHFFVFLIIYLMSAQDRCYDRSNSINIDVFSKIFNHCIKFYRDFMITFEFGELYTNIN